MNRRFLLAASLLAAALVGGALAVASPAAPRPTRGPFENIHVIDFDGEIEAIMLAYLDRRIEAAKRDGADCIVLRIESPGGTIYHGRKIGDLLFELPDSIHVVAWVPKMALSGAAFVSLACDEIILGPGATIGDAQPILQGVGGKPDPVGEKMESPLRAWFSTYAETNGYPVLLAQAMVSERMEVIRVRPKAGGETHYLEGEEFRVADDAAELIPGLAKRDLVQVGPPVVGKDELLTMTSNEALEYGFVARRFDGGLPANEDAVLAALKAPGARVHYAQMSFSENASKWLMTIAGILSAIVAMAVLVFMWQGPGLMTIVGGVALVLVVLINVTADQLNGFPLFLILLGIGLLAAEVFLIPGFGIPGILGLVSMGAGFLFLATGSTPSQTESLSSEAMVSFGLQFVFTAIAGFSLLLVLSRFVPRIGPARRMVLQAPGGSTLPADAVRAAAPGPSVGALGVARSPLRPAGTAEFDGVLTDVVSDGGFVAAGTPVRVIALEGDRVTVCAEGDRT